MLTLSHVQGKTYLVIGLGLSGISACQALIQAGAHVLAWDDHIEIRQQAGIRGINIADINNIIWHDISALILAPGIAHHLPQPHPVALGAMQANIPIICDVELLISGHTSATTIGITGSNGKSTTTALVNHVLVANDYPVQMGGNIGIPVCDLISLGPDGTYVLELSSFQLERIPSLNLDIAVLTNITPDHLDRHGDMAGYLQAKQHIFQYHDKLHTTIISVDDVYCRQFYNDLKLDPKRTIIAISTQHQLDHGIFVKDGYLCDRVFTSGQPLFSLTNINGLKGHHNWQNILHAYAVLHTLGLSVDDIYPALQTFTALPHRLQSLGFINNVEFVNDSKATNPDATAHALAAYNNIYWILGGVAKQSELDTLDRYYARIRQAFVIGQASKRFTEILEPHIPVAQCRDLQHAVQQAFALACQHSHANAQSVVMLSPACASYDQFKNFEHRGQQFQNYFQALYRKHTNLNNQYNDKDGG